MSENQEVPDELSKLEKWAGKPSGWLLSGILLLVIASGKISYTNEDMTTIAIAENIGEPIQVILSLLGIALITIGAIVVSLTWNENKTLTHSILLVFFVTASIIITSDYLSDSSEELYPFDYLSYDVEAKKASLLLSKEYLQKMDYERFVVATTLADHEDPYLTKDGVAYSSIYTKPKTSDGDNIRVVINCEKILPNYKIGDTVRMYLIGLNNDDVIKPGESTIRVLGQRGDRCSAQNCHHTISQIIDHTILQKTTYFPTP